MKNKWEQFYELLTPFEGALKRSNNMPKKLKHTFLKILLDKELLIKKNEK